VVRAFSEARRIGLRTIGLLGSDGGELRELSDVALVVPSNDTQHIQAVHIVLIHLLCELVEERVADAVGERIGREPPSELPATLQLRREA
jgi:DNA-binding MurR/RpiR family transcriptional regulator